MDEKLEIADSGVKNEIFHYQVIIDLDIWSAHYKEGQSDIDDLINRIKEKKLFRNCGNVKSRFIQAS